MLQPFMHLLSTQRLVLASVSPRRKQILENIGLCCEVVPSTFEENLDKMSFVYPYEYVEQTALYKAMSVARMMANDEKPPFVVIGADTVVTLDNKIYEKPTSKDDAFEMLSRFSGRTHVVYTGVVLVSPTQVCADSSLSDAERFYVDKFHAGTEVEFDELSPQTIHAYIETGEPMDKAGGYGIQAVGGTLIKGIHGDYFNVMGFPLNLFAKHMLSLCLRHVQESNH